MRSPVFALALSCAALLLPAAEAPAATEAAAAAPARAVIQDTVNEVLAILGNKDLDVSARRKQLEGLAEQRFDFETMAKLVLKRNWRRFDKDQRTDFVAAFRDYLSRSYGSRIDRYDQEKVDIHGDRVEPRGDVTVLTVIRGGNADGIEVNYRLRDRGGVWRIIDVQIEGVSLIANFRSQFADVLSNGGPDELLRRLREKNAEGDEPKVVSSGAS